MNAYGLIILSALLFEYILTWTADYLNLKNMTADIPELFKGTFDKAKYERTQEYTRARTRFELLSVSFDLVVLLVFWFSGGFAYLDRLIRNWHFSEIFSGILFIGILMFLKFLLDLPFSVYSTFVIEERFGFNKTTLRTFILDILKSLLLSILIGVPVLAGILAFFQYMGDLAWLYCWGFITAVLLFLQFIFPTWILPIFNKFEPLKDGPLREKIFEYAKKVNYSLAGVFIMDGSRRSTKSNAFFTGFGRNKRIVLFDTLVDKFTESELVSILAHEIGHYKKKHILISLIISIAHSGFLFYLLSFFLKEEGLFRAFYMEQPSIYAGLVFFGLLYSPIELFLSVLLNSISRRHEFQADQFAVQTTGSPATFVSALKKLAVDNLINLTPHPFYVLLHSSHPPVLERIKAIHSPGRSQ